VYRQIVVKLGKSPEGVIAVRVSRTRLTKHYYPLAQAQQIFSLRIKLIGLRNVAGG
jgi:hypothetical protein